MEMPIRIIITLFVAVVVGLAIISFADKVILDAKQDLEGFNDDEVEDEDKIIDVTEVSSNSVAALASDCFEKNSAKSIESEMCYVLLGDVKATESGIEDAIRLNQSQYDIDLTGASNAVKIKYNVGLDIVEITG